MLAWIKDTIYRSVVEAVRVWVIAHWMENAELPTEATFYVYSGGPNGIGWGNPAGPDDRSLQPLRYKRIVVTFSIEDDDQATRLTRKAGGA